MDMHADAPHSDAIFFTTAVNIFMVAHSADL